MLIFFGSFLKLNSMVTRLIKLNRSKTIQIISRLFLIPMQQQKKKMKDLMVTINIDILFFVSDKKNIYNDI